MTEDFKTTDVKDTPTLLRTLAALSRPLKGYERQALYGIADAIDVTAIHPTLAPGLKAALHPVRDEGDPEAADRFGAAIAGAYGAQLRAVTGHTELPRNLSPMLDGIGDSFADAFRLVERMAIASEVTAHASVRMVNMSEAAMHPAPEPHPMAPLRDPEAPPPVPASAWSPSPAPLEYQDRARAELLALDNRVKKLGAFVGTATFATLGSDEKRLLVDQHDAMTAYAIALAQRIALWEAAEPAPHKSGDPALDGVS